MDVNDDQQELETLDTLSLTDFALTEDRDSGDQDHKHGQYDPPSPASDQDLFEFGSSGLKQHHMMMSHAEDMISGGKLIPINNQPNHDQQPPTTQNQNQDRHIRHGRCESMRELKSSTNKGTARQLVRNSYSLDYKKLNRNSKLNYEPTGDIYNNRNSLSTKSSSARWTDLVFAPLKVPAEMDLRDIRNRQVLSTSNRFSVSGAGDQHRKTSWGVLGFLSCKRAGSVAVTMPLS